MRNFWILIAGLLFFSNLFCINISTELDTIKTNISQINVGDRIFFDVIIEHKKGEIATFISEVKTETFEILAFQKNVFEKDNVQITDFKFESAFFDIGEQTVPKLEFQIQNDTDSTLVFSDSLSLIVESVLKEADIELRDIKPPLTLHLLFVDWLLPILIIAIITFIIFLIIRIRSKKPIFAEQKKKQIPAHIIALDKLKTLRFQNLLAKRKIKKYYVEISWICREYLENRFKLPFLELTNFEIRQFLNKYRIEQSSKFNRILTACDKVKYAKFTPQLSTAEKIIDNLENLVNDTKLVEKDENRIS